MYYQDMIEQSNILSCPNCESVYHIILYFTIMYYYLLKASLFSNETQEGDGSRWEGRCRESGGSRGRGNGHRIYWVIKESIFNIREKTSHGFRKWSGEIYNWDNDFMVWKSYGIPKWKWMGRVLLGNLLIWKSFFFSFFLIKSFNSEFIWILFDFFGRW